MFVNKKLSAVSANAPIIPFDDSSKIVIMSDCHRGNGEWNDNFARNRNIHYAALKSYYQRGFTYIELGDTDELWKNRSYNDITRAYIDTFRLMRDFYEDGRFYMIYGNHDIVKRDPVFLERHLYDYYDNNTEEYERLLDGLIAYEGIILRHSETDTSILLTHGHQGVLMDDFLWRASRFLVRHIVGKLEVFGFRDLTSAAKNNTKKRRIERRIAAWAEENNQLVITGHTHRPMCSSASDERYYNDGSCVHLTGISCIEIENSEISLVRWQIRTQDDGSFFVDRQLQAKKRKI